MGSSIKFVIFSALFFFDVLSAGQDGKLLPFLDYFNLSIFHIFFCLKLIYEVALSCITIVLPVYQGFEQR